jgi:O-antigen ligase
MIGVGINNYTEVMDDYDITDEGIESYTHHAVHNIYLHVAAETGILGFTALIWLIAAILIEGIKYAISNRGFMVYVVIGMIAGIITFLVHGLVDTASLGNKLYMFVWFFAGSTLAIKNLKQTAMPIRE